MASDLDEERKALSARNERMLQQFGLKDAFKKLGAEMESKKAEVARRPRPPKRPRSLDAAELRQPMELRRSSRFRNEVNYNDDQPVRAEKRRRVESVDVVDVERHQAILAARRARAEERAEAGDGAFRGPRDSGKGWRVQMGKVYDSRTGVTCHWCRQKTVSDKVMCSRPDCGGGRRMPIYFCDRCLLNRHGEHITAAISSGAWVCPCCRESCGQGCVLCCNCGPCRKKAGLPPTGQLVEEASGAGYNNAHDYLVGRATGESQAELTARKHRQVWASWMTATQELEGDEEQGAGGSAAKEEASGESGDEAEEESGDEAEKEEEDVVEAEEMSVDEASGDETTGDEAEEASEDEAEEAEMNEPLAQGPQKAMEAARSAAQPSQEATKPLRPGSAVGASVPAVPVAVAMERQEAGENGSGGGRPSGLRRSSRTQPGKPAAPGPAAVKPVATVGRGRKVRGSPKEAAAAVSSPGEVETGVWGSSVSPGAGGGRSAVAAGLLEAAGEEAEVVAEEEIKVEAGAARKRRSAVGKAGRPAAVTRARAARRMTT